MPGSSSPYPARYHGIQNEEHRKFALEEGPVPESSRVLNPDGFDGSHCGGDILRTRTGNPRQSLGVKLRDQKRMS